MEPARVDGGLPARLLRPLLVDRVGAGRPGQANHAAANAFEGCAARVSRAAPGLPAISINWGPWSGVGAADREEDQEDVHERAGLRGVRPAEGLALLERILGGPRPRSPRPASTGTFSPGTIPPTFGHVPARRPPGWADVADCRRRHAVAPRAAGRRVARGAEPLAALERYLHDLALRILRFPTDRRIEPRQPLKELGLDSLMAVEFRNVLSAAVCRPLPATLLFSYPALEDLMRHLRQGSDSGSHSQDARRLLRERRGRPPGWHRGPVRR